MKLPVCVFDLETDMLCPNCQEKLRQGEITQFDVDISRMMLEKLKQYPELEGLHLLRAVKIEDRLLLVVKKSQEILESLDGLVAELSEEYGSLLILEGTTKLRRVVRMLIDPATEVGINSLYLPDGSRESIVMLRAEDKNRIEYPLESLRKIASAVMGESVLFEYQTEREDETPDEDEFDDKMREYGKKPYR